MVAGLGHCVTSWHTTVMRLIGQHARNIDRITSLCADKATHLSVAPTLLLSVTLDMSPKYYPGNWVAAEPRGDRAIHRVQRGNWVAADPRGDRAKQSAPTEPKGDRHKGPKVTKNQLGCC